MVELICLACGRRNPSDAKFCSQCGAALLRRFCEQCRAVNDAEAHFCHSCGAALSEQVLPATLAPMPDELREETRPPQPPGVPTLNEVLATDEIGSATTATTPPPLQRPDRSAGAPDDGVTQATMRGDRTVLFAVSALIILLLVAALWSRVPRIDVRPGEADTSVTGGAASANVAAPPPAPSVRTEPASTTMTDSSAPVEDNAPGTSGGSKAEKSGPEALPAPFDKPRPATAPRSIATPNRPPRGTATPAPSQAPTPAPECTRQMDALGLCASNATITGR